MLLGVVCICSDRDVDVGCLVTDTAGGTKTSRISPVGTSGELPSLSYTNSTVILSVASLS